MNNHSYKKKYYTIGEICEILSLPSHVIRFWEKSFTALKPQKARGRRYYTQDDINTLNIIRKMLYTDKMSIKAANNMLLLTTKNLKAEKNLLLQNYYQTYSEFQYQVNNLIDRLTLLKNKLV